MEKVAAILLAAGESTRMRQLKALLPWQGTTLLEHQVTALLDGGCDSAIVVLGHRHTELSPLLEGRPGAQWVHNPDYLQGKTTSLKVGLRALGDPAASCILILNVDQPRGADTIRGVIAAHSAKGQLITIPCHQGKGGHPVAVSTTLLPELTEITEETAGLKEVVRRHASETHRVELGIGELLLDLNTPEDYQKALQLVQGTTP